MKILSRNVYVGPNIYANFPVIRYQIDLGELEISFRLLEFTFGVWELNLGKAYRYIPNASEYLKRRL